MDIGGGGGGGGSVDDTGVDAGSCASVGDGDIADGGDEGGGGGGDSPV